MSRGIAERLRDIIDSCARCMSAEDALERARTTGDDALAAIAFDAVAYNLVVIGEAVKSLPEATTSRYPQVPWSEIARMRDFLTHHYFKVDVTVVRATVDAPLAHLLATCQTAVAELEAQ